MKCLPFIDMRCLTGWKNLPGCIERMIKTGMMVTTGFENGDYLMCHWDNWCYQPMPLSAFSDPQTSVVFVE